jgi:hypothetical protein
MQRTEYQRRREEAPEVVEGEKLSEVVRSAAEQLPAA